MKARDVMVCTGLAMAVGMAHAAPTVDGVINGNEGWRLLIEATDTNLVAPGGSTTNSDGVAEGSTFNTWDGLVNNNIILQDNRGDLIRAYVTMDADALYIAIAGPTAPFNSWNNPDVRGRNDIGDLFIALQIGGSRTQPKAIELKAVEGHKNYGIKAVDFLGWKPTHVLGVQFVNNGGGGSGEASIEITGPTQQIAASAPQDFPVPSGFRWNGLINTAAAYDTSNQRAGEFEFRIPWTVLGLASAPANTDVRLAAYVTHNYAGSDAYDSMPGLGNGTINEAIGDAPGDTDDNGLLGAADFSIAGANPGANFVSDLTLSVGRLDAVDTIEGYYSVNTSQFIGCYANCDSSTIPPVLNALDFSCFLSRFIAGDAYANCDSSTIPPVLNALDFSCYLNRFIDGCP